METRIERRLVVPEEFAGARLDQALARLLPDYSRSALKNWLLEGGISLDHARPKPSHRLEGGETIELAVTLPVVEDARPEAMALDIVFEDAHLLVIDKPVGLVVHPGAGNRLGTLLQGLLHHDPELAHLPRAGIVHRLDKDTSGLMVVARSPQAYQGLVGALKEREVERVYLGLAVGLPIAGGRIEAAIGRHPRDRTRMAVREDGRPAATRWRVLERFRGHCLVEARLESGRTHQIRVHLEHAGHPLVGDPTYGGRLRLPAGMGAVAIAALRAFPRQALHATRLALSHPVSGESMAWERPPPEDFQTLLAALRADLASDA